MDLTGLGWWASLLLMLFPSQQYNPLTHAFPSSESLSLSQLPTTLHSTHQLPRRETHHTLFLPSFAQLPQRIHSPCLPNGRFKLHEDIPSGSHVCHDQGHTRPFQHLILQLLRRHRLSREPPVRHDPHHLHRRLHRLRCRLRVAEICHPQDQASRASQARRREASRD